VTVFHIDRKSGDESSRFMITASQYISCGVLLWISNLKVVMITPTWHHNVVTLTPV